MHASGARAVRGKASGRRRSSNKEGGKRADQRERPTAGPAPSTPDALHAWLREHLEIDVPRDPVIAGHAAPFDYLVHAFFEGRGVWPVKRRKRKKEEGLGELSAVVAGVGGGSAGRRSAKPAPIDCVVWANRGGGKTFLGAVATALDLVFKRGIEVRILGGSLEQSKRMHAHLRALFRHRLLAPMVEGKITDRKLRLSNGSQVELLAQSHASVRGTRVQKLRCDEVELFDREVWEAAQLVTRSRRCGEVWVRGAVECLSTMHIPHGVMFGLVREAGEGKRRLFKWGVVDVLESCPAWRGCGGQEANGEVGGGGEGANGEVANGESGGGGDRGGGSGEGMNAGDGVKSHALISLPIAEGDSVEAERLGDLDACALLAECQGRAKQRPGNDEGVGVGHIAIEDAIAMKSRVGEAVWESEMLCLRPRRSDSVLPEFDSRKHVVKELPWEVGAESSGGRGIAGSAPRLEWYGGMDFGTRAATVVLWAAVDGEGVLWVVDEYVKEDALLGEHLAAMKKRAWPKVRWLGVDPAGNAMNDQTGQSAVNVLKSAGFGVKYRRSGITSGLDLIRARLRPAGSSDAGAGSGGGAVGPKLFVHARCERLVESMERYHYSENKEDVKPKKDGSDHAVDALRYLVLNLDRKDGALEQSGYTAR